MSKPRKVKSFKSDTIPVSKMVMRMVEIRRETVNEETKSVEVVIASENPVKRYDHSTGQMYNEILSMDGVQFRTERNQLPIVDSHDRSTVRNVLGSVRNVRVEGSQLIGDASFARDADSQVAFEKLLDGHLTDFSITATPVESRAIKRGESEVIREQTVHGPAEVITAWVPTDASLVAAGADETSTVRELLRAYQKPPIKRMETVDEEQKLKLVEMGMPEEIESAAEAMRWMMERMEGEEAETIENEDDEPVVVVEKADDETKPEMAERSADNPNEIKRGIVTRNQEIRAICKKAKIERAFADTLCDDPELSLDSARQQILERMMTKPLGTSAGGERIEVTANADDKFYRAASDALVMRAMQPVSRRDPFEGRKPAEGAHDLRYVGLRRLSEKILQRAGINTDRMTPQDVAMVALGHQKTINRMRYNGIIRSDVYHTTGILPNLLLDAANKTLLAGYEEAPFTWDIWARQGSSVADFKNINRIRYSEYPDVQQVAEGQDYPDAATSDEKESYNVEKYGSLFTVTWETIVNDDMDAISRIPMMQGVSCRRKQNKTVYAVLTANAAMADGTALFAAGHSNNATSTGAPSVTTLNAAFTAMRTQTGVDGSTIINVMPRYLIVPAALEATALELFTSTGRPDVGGDTTGNSGVQNIYGPGGRRSVEVVAEPQLDGNSATAWYMAADKGSIDTVELTFLQGEESPVLENDWNMKADVYEYKVRQTWGTKAIDWRGLYRNTG